MNPSTLPPELIQLGVAGVVAAIIWYILKLIIDGKLHTDGEVKVLEQRIEALSQQNETLAAALKASNEQSGTVLSLWKTLRDDNHAA